MSEPVHYCDSCGRKMTRTAKCEWYCKKCDQTIFDFSQKYVSDDDDDGGRKCSNCRSSLKGGSYTAPWENGNNSDGYVKCPHCGYINFNLED